MSDTILLDEANLEPEVVADSDAERTLIWNEATLFFLHIVLPIALTGVILGRKLLIPRVWLYLDKSFLSVFCPKLSQRDKISKWMASLIPQAGTDLHSIWTDGSLLCTLVNAVVPGACPNPHRHWRKPPLHGQALAYKYLKVVPQFSEDDLKEYSTEHEALLLDYLASLQKSAEKLSKPEITKHTNVFVARGMGLVTGEQNRKAVIYIYPNQGKFVWSDLLLSIRGPYDTYAQCVFTPLDFNSAAAAAAAAEKSGEGSKKKSFLKSISVELPNLLKAKGRGVKNDIKIRSECEKDRLKITFIPNHSGIYEICFTTNGEHISGSPFNVNVEKNRSGISDDLDGCDEKVSDYKYRGNYKQNVYDAVVHFEKITQKNLNDEKKESTVKISEEKTNSDKINKNDNFGMKIIDTIREIPALRNHHIELENKSIAETKQPEENNNSLQESKIESSPKPSELSCIEPDSLTSSMEDSFASSTSEDLVNKCSSRKLQNISTKSNEDIWFLPIEKDSKFGAESSLSDLSESQFAASSVSLRSIDQEAKKFAVPCEASRLSLTGGKSQEAFAAHFIDNFKQRQNYWKTMGSKSTSNLKEDYTAKAALENSYGDDSGIFSKYGSADELNFPSLKERRDLFLREDEPKVDKANSTLKKDKYRYSIEDKVKRFENNKLPSDGKVRDVRETNMVTNKMKERFNKSYSYFKEKERR